MTLVSIVHTGDSISGGQLCYPTIAFNFIGLGNDSILIAQSTQTYHIGSNFIFRNMGMAGSRLDSGNQFDLVTIAPVYVDPIIPVSYDTNTFNTVRKYVFITAIGSNDVLLANYSTTVEYAGAIAACCRNRKAAGYDLAGICTALPRGDVLAIPEDRRALFNATVKDPVWQAANGIDFAIDIASQPIMGNHATLPDLTYYQDEVHPTNFGQTLLAPIYAEAVNKIISSFNLPQMPGGQRRKIHRMEHPKWEKSLYNIPKFILNPPKKY